MPTPPTIAETGRSSLLSASLLLAGAAGALPFLLPDHVLPLASFQPEWLAIALVISAAMLAIAGQTEAPGKRVRLPAASIAFLILAAFVAIQALVRPPSHGSIPLLGTLYLLFAAVALWTGAQLTHALGFRRVATLIAGCILASALLSATFAFIQYHGRPRWLEDFVAGLSSDRAYGNIAQANLFANYITLGQASLIYLWANRELRTSSAVAAAALLASAGALSGTRALLLFAIGFMALGLLWALLSRQPDWRRLAIASACIGLSTLVAIGFASWIGSSGGPENVLPGPFARTLTGVGFEGEPRWQAWALALRIFLEFPILGSGWGSFAGAAFDAGIAPEMTRYGEVWTSAHNILLHLLAETGLVGTLMVAGTLLAWSWHASRGAQAHSLESGWVLAVVGMQLLHSLVEFPLWSAHFLGLTALIMGAGLAAPPLARHGGTPLRWTLPALIAICLALATGLALSLRDYVLLNISQVTGTSTTLATPDDVKRDSQTISDLARGIFAPVAETRILLGYPVERPADAEALAISARVMRYWPSSAVAIRRALLLAQAGGADEAGELVDKAVRAFPTRCADMRATLERARPANPAAIERLVARLASHQGGNCR
jgi:O-antigen ligase